MTVLDVSGKVLLERTQNFSPGTHSEPLNIDYLDAGIYIVQLSSDNVSLNKKLLIVK